MSSSHAAHVEEILSTARTLRSELGTDSHEQLVEAVYATAARIADRAVTRSGETARPTLDRTIDRLVTSRIWGFPLMFLLFAADVLAHHQRRQRALRLDRVAAGRHGLPDAARGGRRSRSALVAVRPADRRDVPRDGLGRERDAAAHGHLLPALHVAGGLRVPAAGCLQPGLALQEGGRPREAGHDDHDGVRLQRSGRHRHADHRQPARTADRHPHQQLRPVQRSLADADPHRHAVHRLLGARRAGRRGLGARRGGRRGPGGRPDLRDRVGALPYRPPGPGLDVQSRACPRIVRRGSCRRCTPRSSIGRSSCSGARWCGRCRRAP